MSSTHERVVDVFIEIPRGSRRKYEYDKGSGRIRLDRVLFSSVHYPADYGFIENTLSPDGDALDCVVPVQEPTFPGCIVSARPVGTPRMKDATGDDEKVLAVPVGDPRFDTLREPEDVAPHWLSEIETFFATYKMLEKDEPEATGWSGAKEAWGLIDAARERHVTGDPREGARARSQI